VEVFSVTNLGQKEGGEKGGLKVVSESLFYKSEEGEGGTDASSHFKVLGGSKREAL